MSHLTRLQALERTQLREQGQTPVLGSTALDLEMDIVRFASDVLQVDLYPRQATALKVLTAATHLLTLFDEEVLSQWSAGFEVCLLYTSPSPRDGLLSRMPSSA